MIKSFFHSLGLALLLFSLGSCASISKNQFDQHIYTSPDYSAVQNWAALPSKKDSADLVPIPAWTDEQSTAQADVFFIHPTTYTRKPQKNQLNANLNDKKLNLDTDKSTIRYQATIFNGAGKIYAPRYRQANLRCFFDVQHKEEGRKALDLAYADVKSAFLYYLENFNDGRPFIIASHSQGSFHASRLIGELIDSTALQDKLIVAYMPGWPMRNDQYKTVKPCTKPDDTGCFCSWRTFREGYIPPLMHYPGQNITVTNPVTWNCDDLQCTREEQLGGILRDFDTLIPHLVEAEVHDDLLWVNKPLFPGSFLLTTKNYHIADYNFFYADVRKNAQERVIAYFSKH